MVLYNSCETETRIFKLKKSPTFFLYNPRVIPNLPKANDNDHHSLADHAPVLAARWASDRK